MRTKRTLLIILVLLAALGALPVSAQDGGGEDDELPTPADPLGGATGFATLDERTDVTLLLDWVPNTNHTGFYVAQALGYYDEANLDVSIQEPTDLMVETAVTSGAAQFGIGYQEFVTYALADGMPVVSVAAIIQHNTSGFVTLHSEDPVSRPADLAGKRYGGFGLPDLESAVIDQLLVCDGAEAGSVEYIDVGYADPIPLMERDRIDFVWMYYAWTGIDAELRGADLDAIMLRAYPDCLPDYYTPILITSQDMIDTNPDVVAAFVQASARGFAYAIRSPAAAADILIDATPETGPELIRTSAQWLAPQYQADAPRWGQQSLDVWQGFSDFLVENGILAEGIDAGAAFTNDFLPGSVED
ncbi:MAG: ABC transporter substrate-binding protein [Anaerolineae bacterium]|nr:ABC transporter substrate-binding protein [Anaerolineae bacterium]